MISGLPMSRGSNSSSARSREWQERELLRAACASRQRARAVSDTETSWVEKMRAQWKMFTTSARSTGSTPGPRHPKEKLLSHTSKKPFLRWNNGFAQRWSNGCFEQKTPENQKLWSGRGNAANTLRSRDTTAPTRGFAEGSSRYLLAAWSKPILSKSISSAVSSTSSSMRTWCMKRLPSVSILCRNGLWSSSL